MKNAYIEKNGDVQQERERIEHFDRELLRCNSKEYETRLCVGIYETIILLFMLIPYQEVQGETLLYIFAVQMTYPAALYLMPFLRHMEGKKWRPVFEKIKYLPAAQKAVRFVRIKYLLRFLKRTFPAAFLLQLLSALLFRGKVEPANVVYAALLAGVFPFIANLLLIFSWTRQKKN